MTVVDLMHGRDPAHKPVASGDYGRTCKHHGYATRIPRRCYIE